MFHLRYFVAVAEELNFSAAARRLHMATSPLSQRIRDLEKELGHRLFERDSHSVTLTSAGEALLPLAQGVLEQINAMPWRLQEATRPGRCSMVVGIATGMHPRLRELLNVLAERVEDRCELLLIQLARLQDQGIFRDEHSALAKTFVCARMREVVAWSRELFGGNGLVLEYDVAQFFSDAEALYSYEGTHQMQTLIVGKSITGQSAFVG